MHDEDALETILHRLEVTIRNSERDKRTINDLTAKLEAASTYPKQNSMSRTQFLSMVDSIASDRFIDTIKMVRTAFGMTLTEAKHLTDRIRIRKVEHGGDRGYTVGYDDGYNGRPFKS